MLKFLACLNPGGEQDVTEQEINRAVQYVTASTSYGRETVAQIIKTGFGELESLAATSSAHFERPVLLEYVCRWTIQRTGQPEPLVREVLGCAGRWLDQMCEAVAGGGPAMLKDSENEAR